MFILNKHASHPDTCLSLSWVSSGKVQLLLRLRQFVLQTLLPPVQELPARSVRLPAGHEASSKGHYNGDLQCPLRDISHVHTLDMLCVCVCATAVLFHLPTLLHLSNPRLCPHYSLLYC